MNWTPKEIEILRANYPTMGGQVCQLIQGRRPIQCIQKANALGLKLTPETISRFRKEAGRRRTDSWTPEEERILRENYPTMGTYKLFESGLLNRTKAAIYDKAGVLNLYFNQPEEEHGKIRPRNQNSEQRAEAKKRKPKTTKKPTKTLTESIFCHKPRFKTEIHRKANEVLQRHWNGEKFAKGTQEYRIGKLFGILPY